MLHKKKAEWGHSPAKKSGQDSSVVLLMVENQKAGPSVLVRSTLALRGGPSTPVSVGSPIREVLEEDLDLLSTPDASEAAPDLIAMTAQSLAFYSCAPVQVQVAQAPAVAPLPMGAPPIQYWSKSTMMHRHSPSLWYHSQAPLGSTPP